MFSLTIAFLTLSLILTYKNFRHVSTRFLFGIISGWILSLVSLLLYLSKHNYYYNIITKFFPLDLGLWNRLVLTNLNIDWLIRLLNLGVLSFIYAALGFSVAFTRRQANPTRPLLLYLQLAILPCLEFLFYDPVIYRRLEQWFNTDSFLWESNLFHIIFHSINALYLLSALLLLFHYYRTYPNIKFLKKYALINLLCLLPVLVVHYLMFSWLPKVLVSPTVIKGYFNYAIPDLNQYIILFNIFPYISFIAFAFMIFLIYKYNSIETYYRNQDVHIKQSIDTASLGIRAFTHAIKNHLLAIESEASFLKEKFAADQEAQQSLTLILNSCYSSFRNMEQAAEKLKHINLDLQPLPLDLPLQKALARITAIKSKVAIITQFGPDLPTAYIDESNMTETFYNIITNALEALGKQPDGQIVISIQLQGQWGIIAFADNGPGIPEEHLEQIFTPFFSTKAAVANWGIGLSYCHKIVAAHEGSITVESQVGQGTTFKIMLPVVG